ncbi:MAG: UDP-2,3-diacylglucosamine diphosphatase [Planctomycetota bacterium]
MIVKTAVSHSDLPTSAEPRQSRPVRTAFVSDLHIGIRQSRVEAFNAFLQVHQPEMLYLVGDFLDARALRLCSAWQPCWDTVFETLAQLASGGTQIFYTPGNHDDYLRHVNIRHIDIEIHDQFTHTTVDGRRVSVLHGDQFDDVEHHAHWLSMLGSFVYTWLLHFDRGLNRTLAMAGMKPRRLSRYLKQSTKRIVKWISGFDDDVFAHARDQCCDVIVCGHTHIPAVRRFDDDKLYFNLGDWLENATGLVEHPDGELELIDVEQNWQLYAQQPTSHEELSPRGRGLRDALISELTLVG